MIKDVKTRFEHITYCGWLKVAQYTVQCPRNVSGLACSCREQRTMLLRLKTSRRATIKHRKWGGKLKSAHNRAHKSAVVGVHVRDFRNQGVVRVRIGQQRADRQQHLHLASAHDAQDCGQLKLSRWQIWRAQAQHAVAREQHWCECVPSKP